VASEHHEAIAAQIASPATRPGIVENACAMLRANDWTIW
jgi:hypothetical protein